MRQPFPGPGFFPYRKRKQLSVDGRTPGLEYPRRHRGSAQPPPTGHSAQHHRGDDYLGGQDTSEYQPGRSFYSSSPQHYHRPAPWHDLQVEPTPPFRMPLPDFSEEPESPSASAGKPWMDKRLVYGAIRTRFPEMTPGAAEIDAAVEQLQSNPAALASLVNLVGLPRSDQEAWLTMGEFYGVLEAPMTYDLMGRMLQVTNDDAGVGSPIPGLAGVPEDDEPGSTVQDLSLDGVVDAVLDALEPDDLFANDLSGPGEEQASPSLEDIVDREMLLLDPFAVPDPMPTMDPYGPPPPPGFGPGMPMDPSDPMGFGPGF